MSNRRWLSLPGMGVIWVVPATQRESPHNRPPPVLIRLVHLQLFFLGRPRSHDNGKDGGQPHTHPRTPTHPTHNPHTTTKKNNATSALQDPTNGEAPIWEIANSNLTSEQLRRRAAPLLIGKDILRSVLSLSPEDQARFIDKVGHVCRNG